MPLEMGYILLVGLRIWYDMLFSLWKYPQIPRKATETRLKLVAHDIRRIGYIETLDGIKPNWPRKGI
jgi:hypothetical protein